MVDHVFVDQLHRRLAWRAVGDILEAGECLGGGCERHELQRFFKLGRAFDDAPRVEVVKMAVPYDGEGFVLAANRVEEAPIRRLNEYRAAIVQQLRRL